MAEPGEFVISYKGFVHCDSKTRVPDEITVEGLHDVFTTKKLMKQAQSENPLAGRGFKKPVTLFVDEDGLRLANNSGGDVGDLLNTQLTKIILAKEVDANVYVVVRRTKQEGKFACHCMAAKAKDQSEQIAARIMQLVAQAAAGGGAGGSPARLPGQDAPDEGRASSMASSPARANAADAARDSGIAGGASSTKAALLKSMMWYHGTVSRGASEELLKDKPPGTFLVRYSDKKGEYCVTLVVFDGSVQHFVTRTGQDGRVSLHGHKNQYDSMVDLVDHYSRYDITSEGDRCMDPCPAVRSP